MGALLAILTAFIGGVYVIFIKKTVMAGDSLGGLFAVISVNVAVFLPLSLLHYPNFGITTTSLLSFIMAGLLGTFVGRVFQYISIERIGVARAEAISRGSLIVSTVLAIMALGEPITLGHLLGIIFLMVGILILGYEVSGGKTVKIKSGRAFWLTILFPFISLFFFGIESPFSKVGLLEGTPAMVGLTIKFSGALVGLAIYLFLTNRNSLFLLRGKERNLYLITGLLASAVHGLRYASLGMARVVVVDPFLSLTPLFVLLLSYLLYRDLEKITTPVVIGSALVVFGAIAMSIFM